MAPFGAGPLPVGVAACFFGLSSIAMMPMSASSGLDLTVSQLCHFVSAFGPRRKGLLHH